jgi:hypothetical protein
MGEDWKKVSIGIWYRKISYNDPFHRMFDNGRYSQASVAFLRAGRDREAAICDAYLLREKARSISITTSTTRIQAFVTAASAFITCAQDSPRVNERLAYYGAAGECYLEAHDLKKAGDNYRMAEQYDEATLAYLEGGYFNGVAAVIIRHGNTLESGLRERSTMITRMYYFKVYFNGWLVSKSL